MRGSLLILCGDGPGRVKFLGCKAMNSWSLHPCPYCLVMQSDDDKGGELGDGDFDIDTHARTWGQILDGFAELEALAGDPAKQTERSKQLGLVVPGESGLPSVYKFMRLVPIWHIPVERLHFGALVSCFEAGWDYHKRDSR